jgi:adenosylcobinamide-phosphate synthase
MEIILMLLLALLLDLAFGEPPDALHPVAWMGKAAALLGRIFRGRSPAGQFVSGLLVTLMTIAIFGLPVYYVMAWLTEINTILYVVAGAALLKTTFSLRGLHRAARRVSDRLKANRLDEARYELRALVSRDTGSLSPTGVASAAVESVAENASDSFVAPLFYFLIFGLPGAIAYRVVNTMDAMFGYHGEYEYTGKFAARLDDILNYIPARLTALLLTAAAGLLRRHGRRAWQTMRQDHALTESPNAGWPMAAAAGALGVRLEKAGAYVLGNDAPPPEISTIDRSLKLMQMATTFWVIICLAAGGVRLVFRA